MTNRFVGIVWICALACTQSNINNNEMSLTHSNLRNTMIPSANNPSSVPGEPIKVFNTLEELRTWASESSYGGGRLIVLEQKEATYLIADRMFTSGMISSEANVFRKNNDKYVHVYYLPLKYVSRRYELVDGDLVVTEQSGTQGEKKFVIKKQELQVR